MEENTEYKPFVSGQYDPEEPGFYNAESTLTASKNDCPSGSTASSVMLTANANQFRSTISQTDANEQALAWLNANAQAYANNSGTCTIRPTAWRGINPSCVMEPSTTLSPFDYMVIRYKWALGAGEDLDTFTGFVNTGIDTVDNKWMGYSAEHPDESVLPIGYNAEDSYIMWSGDVQDLTGVETCLVSFKKLGEVYPDLNTIQVRMAGVWWGPRDTGNIDVEIETYLGGTMTRFTSGYNFENNGGTQVQKINVSKNISVEADRTELSIDVVTNIGYITYNIITSQAQIVITY